MPGKQLTNPIQEEMETLTNPHEVKARKEHSCNFCGEKIPKGGKYIKSTHVYDGVYDFKAHDYCSKLAHDLNMHEAAYDGVTQDDFMESVDAKYMDVITAGLRFEDHADVINQLRYVHFRQKLWYVIRHLKQQKST